MFGRSKKIFVCPVWHKIVLTAYLEQRNPARKLKILSRYGYIISQYLSELTGEVKTELSTELLRFPVVSEVV